MCDFRDQSDSDDTFFNVVIKEFHTCFCQSLLALGTIFQVTHILNNVFCLHQVAKEADLRERHLGDLQGVVFHEAQRVKPEAHKAFVSSHEDQEIPFIVVSILWGLRKNPIRVSTRTGTRVSLSDGSLTLHSRLLRMLSKN
ncbi:hypothetical protein SASPL_141141 [Salvia splendens]|uniref:Uncharacterized protein n=1 Tax=Salvia splendens TaxID=180675 RepID=A0A8X8WQ13_SALSN|nr:hypothetical protein SASPL_141141 [Salvia splendens]